MKHPNVKYHFRIGPEWDVTITQDNVMTVDADGDVAVVQLASDEEADRAIAEAQDEEGELMYLQEAIFSKYEELQRFRP
jgi:hypothetical protein